MLSHLRTLLIRTATLASMLLAAAAPAQTFSNPATITVSSSGPASPYPSNIVVSGVRTPVSAVRVTLRGITHRFPSDLAIAVRSPAGTFHILTAECGNMTDGGISGGVVTFSSAATNPIGPMQSGEFAPSRCSNTRFAGGLPSANAMTLGFGPLASVVPNGTWSLYVYDDVTPDGGTIANGWSIGFEPAISASGRTTYQGALNVDGAPFTGQANVEFRIFGQPTGGTAVRPVQTETVQVTNGIFTAPLEFGGDVGYALTERWLQVTVNGQTLTPRQAIRPAPTALSAQSAETVFWSGLLGQPVIETDSVDTGWQLFFTNNATGFRGGMRLADNGFFEVTNVATNVNPNFARLSSTGAWTAVSDRRLKHDIHAAEGNLAAALKLQPVSFRWNNTDTLDLGLIAQDVREVLPYLVTGDESKENLTVNYSQLSVVAIGAIQEQQKKIESLEQRLLDQTRRNDDLQSRLETLEQLLGATK